MDAHEDKDLSDVMKEETSRGTKRPVKAVSLQERRRLQALFTKLIEHDLSEHEVTKILYELGYNPGDERYQQILQAWKEYSGK